MNDLDRQRSMGFKGEENYFVDGLERALKLIDSEEMPGLTSLMIYT